MIYTQQLKEFLNELKLAEGKNCLLIVILDKSPNELKKVIESNGFKINEVYLEKEVNLLEILIKWEKTPENTVYLAHGLSNQFLWVLGYLNLHRDLFYDIKRPIIISGSEYEISEIARYAPDLWRFRSRTYDFTEKKKEEGFITSLPEPEPVYYILPIFKEEDEEKLKERIKVDEYLLGTVRDDYKKAELYMSLAISYLKLDEFEKGKRYFEKSTEIKEKLSDKKGISINYKRVADIFLWKGHLEEAVGFYSSVLEWNPNLAEAYLSRGAAYDELNQHERAIKDYDKAIEINPNYVEAYYNRGVTYTDLNQYEKATRDYNKAIELNPVLAMAYFNRGFVYNKLNQHERAIKDYNKAIELREYLPHDKDAQAYNNRGVAYAKLKQHEKAIKDYDKVIELNPNLAVAYQNRGIAYDELNQCEKAIKDFDKAIELNPQDAEAYNNRGIAYGKSNQLKKAIKDFDKVVELNPQDAGAYNNRGIAYGKLNQLKKAIKDFNKAIELNPNLTEAYLNRGNAYAELNQCVKAIQNYNKAIEINPNDAEAYYSRGVTYTDLNQYENAIKDYNKAIELNPVLAVGYYNRGFAYGELNQHERAIQDYNKAIELREHLPDDKDAQAYTNRGVAYSELNQHERAIQDYNKAIDLNPDLAEAYVNRGSSYSEIGRYDEATRDLKNAGILLLNSERAENSAEAFSTCFDFRDRVASTDVTYCGLAQFFLTSDEEVLSELKKMRIGEDILRKIFELTRRKLKKEDISEEIRKLEGEKKREDLRILIRLLKET